MAQAGAGEVVLEAGGGSWMCCEFVAVVVVEVDVAATLTGETGVGAASLSIEDRSVRPSSVFGRFMSGSLAASSTAGVFRFRFS